jgi:SAM-dependent methyltransferase
MTDLPDPVAWYDAHASAQAAAYEAVDPAELHNWLIDLLPSAPALVLDVGAGSGRDAAWLARLGHDVVAVEPSAGLRAEAAHHHGSPSMRWIADRLPALSATLRLGLAFDLILLSEVWQHIVPTERGRALRKLLGLLRPGGVLAISLRHGPAEAARGMHPVSPAELERLARDFGAMVVRTAATADELVGQTSRGPASPCACPTTAPAPCPCLGTSFSTTRKAQPTSWDCCGYSAVPPMAKPASRMNGKTAALCSRSG